MNTPTRPWSRSLARVRPIALTLALAAALAGGAQAAPMMGGGHDHGAWSGSGMGPGMGPGGMMGGMVYRMLDRVNATPEQRTQIRQIMDRARTEMRAQYQANQGLRDEALALFAQPNIDAAAVEALRQKMQAQHEAASKRMTQSMLEVANVLTPEQRKQMTDYLRERRELMQRHQRERRSLDGNPRS